MNKALPTTFIYLFMLSAGLIYEGIAQELKFGYDIRQVPADSGKTKLEFHIAVSDTQFVYKKSSSGLNGFMSGTLTISSGLDTVDFIPFNIRNTLFDNHGGDRKVVVKTVYAAIKPGRYSLSISLRDRQRSTRVSEKKNPLIVRSFASNNVSLSETLFLERKKEGSADSVSNTTVFMQDTGLTVIPSAELSGEMPLLIAGTVINNPDWKAMQSDSFDIVYTISDAVKRPILDMGYRRTYHAASQEDVFEQPVHILPTGAYYLGVTVTSRRGVLRDSVSTTRKFFILNPAYPPELSDLFSEDQLFLASEFATMNFERIQEEYEKAKRVGPDIELISFQQLSSLNAKQKFIFRFWYHKDPDPTTVLNERYEDFKKAVEHARLNYTSSFAPRGWDCDRGRILMKYGFPTNIDRNYFNWDGAFPHETWVYDKIQGGVIFVFVDKRGSGNVILVHSTALNEHRDELWYKRYAVDPSQNR